MADKGTDLDDFADYMSAWNETDRKRGIFTKRDREYLLEEAEVSGQDELNLLYRMRQRLKQSLYDTNLLSGVPDDELGKVLEDEKLSVGMVINSFVRFVYRLAVRTYDDTSDELADTMERIISSKYHDIDVVENDVVVRSADVNVDISVDRQTSSLRNNLEDILYQDDSNMYITNINTYIEMNIDSSELGEQVAISLPDSNEEVKVQPIVAALIEDIKSEDE
jgi:predicted oxidoreductase